MTNQHSVTMLSNLVEQLESDIDCYKISTSEALARAYAAGADQELEACCEWVTDVLDMPGSAICLREDRRPKPLSLKEEAIDTLHLIRDHLPADMYEKSFLIRRALEALPD
jgi:hypothetical protein